MRALILTCEDPDLRDLALLSLAQKCNLLELVFLKDELKLARRRIYELSISKGLNDQVAQSIEEIGNAVEAFVAED